MSSRASCWALTLPCGHVERRPAVWRPGSASAKWPPSRVLCSTCAKARAADGLTPGPKLRVRVASLRAGNRVLVVLRFTPRKIGGVAPAKDR